MATECSQNDVEHVRLQSHFSLFCRYTALSWSAIVTCNRSFGGVCVLSRRTESDLFHFIRPSSDGTYYGMVMSVRPGLRPSIKVFRTFLLHALTY